MESKDATDGDELYHFLDIDHSNIGEYASVMQEIWDRDSGVDGIIIRNVLSATEVSSIKNDLHKVRDLEVIGDTGVLTCPKAFAQVASDSMNDDEKLQDSFIEMEEIWKRLSSDFEVSIVEKIRNILSDISGFWRVEVPKGTDGTGIYTPATFRRLLPDVGSLAVHCGNQFHTMSPHIFNHIKRKAVIKDQMSFFITLQPAEIGGELILYDVGWDEAEGKAEAGPSKLEMKNGGIKDLEDPNMTKTRYFKPNAGDLLCFAGGRIWHKVSLVKGGVDRITLGGFLTPSIDNSKVFFWS